MKFLGNTVVFVILYILFMLPTYYLPYLGSNSAILGALGAAAGAGVNPAFWPHLGSLIVLIVVAWFRGALIDKKWLIIFPILATVFDLTPGINNIPLVPTVMHLLAIILGVVGAKTVDGATNETISVGSQSPPLSTNTKQNNLPILIAIGIAVLAVIAYGTNSYIQHQREQERLIETKRLQEEDARVQQQKQQELLAAKVAALEKSREVAREPAEQFFWVTADVPSCVTIPHGDSILASVGKEGNLKVIYPDGAVMRIGPKQRAPVRSFEAGKQICFLLDDGETEPIKMRLKQ